jgi:hypothetical protein
MADTVLAQLAALKTAPIGTLKQKWRDLFETEPPPYNRRFLEHRLAYRIQELAYGGLKPETLKRLRANPHADASLVEGTDFRSDRSGNDADAHPKGRQAIPLLRLDRRAQA